MTPLPARSSGRRRPPPSATSDPGPASCSTWTSRNWAGSPTAAAGAPTAREIGRTGVQKRARIGFDYVHSIVDDHSRAAYSEIHADEKATTTAAFFERAVAHFAGLGITRIEAVMTDNAFNYTRSNALAQLLDQLGARHLLIKPHCPWQNGKVERFNRTLQAEWAYRHVFATNDERTAALDPWLKDYNLRRRHSAIGGRPPISRLSPT